MMPECTPPPELLRHLQEHETDLWLLLDGAHSSDPLRVLYTLDDTQEYIPLFLGTRYAELLRISPLLLKVGIESPLFTWYLNERAHDVGLLFGSRESPDAIAGSLRNCLTIKTPGGNDGLFRFYDPQIFTDLLRHECHWILGRITDPMDLFVVLSCDMQNIAAWIHGTRVSSLRIPQDKVLELHPEDCELLEAVNEKRLIMRHVTELRQALGQQPTPVKDYVIEGNLSHFALRAYPAPHAHQVSADEYVSVYKRLEQCERMFGPTNMQDLFTVDMLLETADEQARQSYIQMLSDRAVPLSVRVEKCTAMNKED